MSKRLVRILVWKLFVALPLVSSAQAGSLDGYLFDTRPILLFTSSEKHPALREQLKAFAQFECEFYKRDMEVLTIVGDGHSIVDGAALSSEEVSFLKDELDVGPYNELLVLVGKDGKVKLRAHMPLKANDLIRLVDAMPLRRIEKVSRPQVSCHAA